MAWIESHQSLKEHPKTLHLAELLDIDIPFAIGLLHCFWWWCLDYAEDGDLSHFSPRTIARGSLWAKDSPLFLNALITSGFVDRDESSIRIHDWDEYSGRLVERRRQDRERKKQAFHNNSYGNPSELPQTSNGTPSDLPRHSSVTDQPTNRQTVTDQPTDVPRQKPTLLAAAKKRRTPALTTITKPQDLLALFSEDENIEIRRLFPGIDLSWEASKCLDWHNSRNGSGNWKLAFKNWLGKANSTGGQDGRTAGTRETTPELQTQRNRDTRTPKAGTPTPFAAYSGIGSKTNDNPGAD